MLWRRRPRKDPEVRRHKPKCSFCGKEQGEPGGQGRVRMVAGPGVYICSDCIVLANEILRGDNSPAPA